MDPLVPLADALTFLGVTPATPEETKVERILDAISAEFRRRTRRAFEGVPTIYDQVVRVGRSERIVLPHVPVDSVLSLRSVAFDETEDAVLEVRDLTGGASTTLAAAAAAGDTNLKVTAIDDLTAGDHLRVGSGDTLEVVRVATVGTAGSGGTGLDVEPALRSAQASGGAVVEANGSPRWRLEDAERGRIHIRPLLDYARVVWRVSGEIPADVTQAIYEWLDEGWEAQQEPDLDPDTREVTSEGHDSWSQTYAESDQGGQAAGTIVGALIARQPPPRVERVLLSYFHPAYGGPV